MNPLAVCHPRRANPQLIDALVAQPAFLYGFQTGFKQLQAVFPSRFRFRFERIALGAMPIRLRRLNRLLLITKGWLSAMLAQRLLRAPGAFALDHLRLRKYVLSQAYAFADSSSTTPRRIAKTRGIACGV
jgi:hypothetical protein